MTNNGDQSSKISNSPDQQSSGFFSNSWQRLKNIFARHPDEQILKESTLEGIVQFIKDNKCKNIIVMTGAGVSTAAGIPDFRSPSSGLYANMGKYNLPHPQAMFEIHYFKFNPEPFFALAKQLLPIKLKPTISHYFLRLLHEKGLLLRNFTQNIDSLENMAGVPEDKIVTAHGSFNKGHCMQCQQEYDFDSLRTNIEKHSVPRCESCQGVVKPDVVLFGEALPAKFFTCASSDFPKCDLLIIMGTSLVVQPFASLVDKVNRNVPRILINLEKAGTRTGFGKMFFGSGLDFDGNRDVFWKGTCDEGSKQFAKLLGWEEQFANLISCEWKKLDDQYVNS